MNIQQVIALGLGVLVLVTVGGLMIRFHLGHRRADRVWAAARYPKLKDVETVKHLIILPLIDRHTARDPSTSSGQVLVGEPGVSYLVLADDTKRLAAPIPAFNRDYGTKVDVRSVLRRCHNLGAQLPCLPIA